MLAQISAATVAPASTEALPVSVRRNERSGVSMRRAHAVRSENGPPDSSAAAASQSHQLQQQQHRQPQTTIRSPQPHRLQLAPGDQHLIPPSVSSLIRSSTSATSSGLAGRLIVDRRPHVEQHKPRPHDQCPEDRATLLMAAGQPVRIVCPFLTSTETVQVNPPVTAVARRMGSRWPTPGGKAAATIFGPRRRQVPGRSSCRGG